MNTVSVCLVDTCLFLYTSSEGEGWRWNRDSNPGAGCFWPFTCEGEGWRWNRDSNPGKVALHTLSKRADSAALAFHQIYFKKPLVLRLIILIKMDEISCKLTNLDK